MGSRRHQRAPAWRRRYWAQSTLPEHRCRVFCTPGVLFTPAAPEQAARLDLAGLGSAVDDLFLLPPETFGCSTNMPRWENCRYPQRRPSTTSSTTSLPWDVNILARYHPLYESVQEVTLDRAFKQGSEWTPWCVR